MNEAHARTTAICACVLALVSRDGDRRLRDVASSAYQTLAGNYLTVAEVDRERWIEAFDRERIAFQRSTPLAGGVGWPVDDKRCA